MIIAPQKKKLAMLIVERMGKKPDFIQKLGDESKGPSMENEVEMDDSMAVETIAEDILKAIESKNAKELAICLKDFFVMVDEKEDEEEDLTEGEMSGDNEPTY